MKLKKGDIVHTPFLLLQLIQVILMILLVRPCRVFRYRVKKQTHTPIAMQIGFYVVCGKGHLSVR